MKHISRSISGLREYVNFFHTREYPAYTLETIDLLAQLIG